jgi:acetyl-CoA C-acetyltransferase
MTQLIIVGGALTPIGSFRGAPQDIPAHTLKATAEGGASARAGSAFDEVDQLAMACIAAVADSRHSLPCPTPGRRDRAVR